MKPYPNLQDATARSRPPFAPPPDPAAPPEPPPAASPAATTAPLRTRRLPIDEKLVSRGDAAQRALDEVCPGGAADERILHELVAKQLPIALMLHDLEEQLATRMLNLMDDPRLALAIAKVLRETAVMASAMSKRVQATLSTAASLRAQRRFLTLHGRVPESNREV